MTREEAIEFGKMWLQINEDAKDSDTYNFFKFSIEALEQETVLDKVRAEILEEKEYTYANFEAYKIDYLMQDEEDVLDSLPQDDFRYGLEAVLEIIDKYKADTEAEDGNDD